MVAYDSSEDTKEHIRRVQYFMGFFLDALYWQKELHDTSKLKEPEKRIFDYFTPKLRETTYGSKEYKKYLHDMKQMLWHHYNYNSHHPEHFPNRISGMTLMDLIEMICDWRAATERHADGDIIKSIEINRKRFHLSNQLYQILLNTAKWLENANGSCGSKEDE